MFALPSRSVERIGTLIIGWCRMAECEVDESLRVVLKALQVIHHHKDRFLRGRTKAYVMEINRQDVKAGLE